MNLSLFFLILLVVSATVSLGLVVFAIRHWYTNGALFFALVLAGECIWTSGYLFELIVPSLVSKIVLDNLQFIGTDLVSIGSLLFALSYTGRNALAYRIARILWILPVLNQFIIWTDPYHHLVRTSLTQTTYYTFSLLFYTYGPWMWVSISCCYILVFVGLVILVGHLFRIHFQYKIQVIGVIFGLSAGLTSNIITVLGLVPIPGLAKLDIAPIAFIIVNPIWAWSLFRHRLLDLAPVACDVLMEHMPDGLIVVDTRHRIIDVNPSTQHLLRYSSEQLIGTTITHILPPVTPLLSQNVGDTSLELELIVGEQQQDTLWVEMIVSRLTDHRGCMIGWLIMLRDRTSHYTMQSSLRESEQNLVRAQQIAKMGSFRHNVLTHEITWSKNLSRIVGLGDEEHTFTLEETMKLIHPDDLPSLLSRYHSIVRGETEKTTIEFRCKVPNRAMRYVQEQIEAVYDKYGQVVAVFGIVQDMTERRLAEMEVRKLSSAVQQSSTSVVITDVNGIIEYVNPWFSHLTGYSLEEAKGKTPRILKSGTVSQEVYQQLWITILSGKEWRGEFHNRKKDGTLYWESASISPIFNESGVITHFVAVKEDITERKRIEHDLHVERERAESANRAKSSFLANMSHELRTPLNAILGFSQMLQRNSNLSPEHLNYLSTIHRSGEHLLCLINDILDMSKIEAGHMTYDETVFDLYDTLSSIEHMFRPQVKDEVSFSFLYDPHIPKYICTDEMKLRQVIINLLSNALKFTTCGTVVFRAQRGETVQDVDNTCGNTLVEHHITTISPTSLPQPQSVVLNFEVKDTGPGIDPEDMQHLFEAFTQTSVGRQSQEGTGLGLAISRQYVRLMGGDMWVQSDIGHGSTFSFSIVATLAPEEALLSSSKSSKPRQVIGLAANQPSCRILVVDDNNDSRQLLLELLRSVGFEVWEAYNGQQAVELWKEWHPHLIWMDIQMPIMNGYEATKCIKAMDGGQDTVIVALTASIIDGELAVRQSVGYDDFLHKPYREEQVFGMIATHLGTQYVYADEIGTPNASPRSTTLTTDMFTSLPHEWVQELHRSSVLGDGEALLSMCGELEPKHQPLATTIRHLTHTFQFGSIAEITAQVVGGEKKRGF